LTKKEKNRREGDLRKVGRLRRGADFRRAEVPISLQVVFQRLKSDFRQLLEAISGDSQRLKGVFM
jgi:hypothetical protein